jgi:hypothetical protein
VIGGPDGLDGHAAERIARAEHVRALEEFEAQLARRSLVPDSRKLLVRRISVVLRLLGAGAIGIFVAMATVLLNFIIFTRILHL